MSKDEFLNRLGQLLADIPDSEREEALRYYEDYFADADDQSEEELVEKLGTPEAIARQIKLDLYNKASKEGGLYTESGYTNAYFEQDKETPEVIGTKEQKQQSQQTYEGYQNQNQNYQNQSYQNQNAGYQGYQGQNPSYERPYQQPRKHNTALIVLLIITCPIWGSAAFGILAGLGGTLFGITVASICTFGGLAIAGVICFGCGIGQLFVSPLTGVLLLGVACILVAIGLLALIVFLLIVGKLIPWVVRGIVNVCSRFVHREERTSWQRQ